MTYNVKHHLFISVFVIYIYSLVRGLCSFYFLYKGNEQMELLGYSLKS